MDNLVEQVVKKKKDARYFINVALIIFVAVAIPATLFALAFVLGMPYLIYLAVFAFILELYGIWYFITSMRIEYEYAFLSSTLRIDKVIAKRKRKPVVKVDVKSLDNFFPFSDEEMSKHKFAKIYRAGESEFSTDNYVASFHSEAKGRCAIIFTPNETLIQAMKPYFSVELRKQLFKEKRL